MESGDEPAELLEHVEPVEFGRPAAAVGECGETEVAAAVQGRAADVERCDDGQLGARQLDSEAVLLEDRLVGPAFGPVELDDPVVAPAHADPVDAVLVAVQRQQAAVDVEAERFASGENVLGLQRLKGGGGVRRLTHGASLYPFRVLLSCSAHGLRKAAKPRRSPRPGMRRWIWWLCADKKSPD